MSLNHTVEKPLSRNEALKEASNYLRGTILEGLANPVTGALSEEDTQLTKFHGTYQQDNRDIREARAKKKLENAYSFMIRVRLPGGVCTPEQWLQMDAIATRYANGTLKMTTRQTFQFHGVLKRNLKTTMQEINRALLTTIAACGDVNRNVMCNPNPHLSSIHPQVIDVARKISDHLIPRTRAYHEIWLDGEKVLSSEEETEPLYGKTYLPRKFKIVVAVPPSNDVDVYAHDLGFIAIVDDKGALTGFNVTVGGGMGMTHNQPETYPRLADVMGFCTVAQAVEVAEKVMLVQRDYGDRSNRAHARMKYTVDDHGLDWFRNQVEERLGYPLGDPRPFLFKDNGDRYGWAKGVDGRWHLTLFIENGRVRDREGAMQMTGMREIAKVHEGDFRLTPNQNVMICGITDEQRPKIEELVKRYNLDGYATASSLRLNAIACVALPTCGLALAESERNLPELITELENVIEEAGLRHDAITIRSSGCPNGCARPYIAEIALVGRAPGKYNLYLGAGFAGQRLNKLYKESLSNEEIVTTLEPIIRHYAKERLDGEHFGDFVIRTGYVTAVHNAATDWWA